MAYTYSGNYSGRPLVYPNEVPFDTDLLRESQYRMVDVAMLAQAIIGLPSTIGGSFSGYASGICTQNASPNMTVEIGTCSLYYIQEMEPIAYGNLGPLTTPLLYKQALNLIAFNSSTLSGGTFVAPSSGNWVYYLIQGQFNTSQINNVSRPYYNANDPTNPNFNSNFDTEIDSITFSVVAGTPSSKSGPLPALPTVSAGNVGMFLVLVSDNTTSIINSLISNYPVSLLAETLPEKISKATADTFYVPQSTLPFTAIHTQKFSTHGSGTYTPTAGMQFVLVRAQAAAGSGGGSASAGAGNNATGSGGSGGEYIEALFTAAQVGAGLPYVVGQGGAAPSAGDNNGNPGTNTTFNTNYIIATAGVAGSGGAARSDASVATAGLDGGSGGSVTVGTLLRQISGGGSGYSISLTGTGLSGAGGNAGCGAAGARANADSNGGVGSSGAGGAGASSNQSTGPFAGGAGGDGFIEFIEYVSVV